MCWLLTSFPALDRTAFFPIQKTKNLYLVVVGHPKPERGLSGAQGVMGGIRVWWGSLELEESAVHGGMRWEVDAQVDLTVRIVWIRIVHFFTLNCMVYWLHSKLSYRPSSTVHTYDSLLCEGLSLHWKFKQGRDDNESVKWNCPYLFLLPILSNLWYEKSSQCNIKWNLIAYFIISYTFISLHLDVY